MPIRSAPTKKRIRAIVAGRTVADSLRARLVYTTVPPETYAVPQEDLKVQVEWRTPHELAHIGTVQEGDIVDGPPKAVRRFLAGPALDADLKGHVALAWDRMDAWYEEDEEVFIHPRDPRSRIDVLASSRPVEVRLGDVVLATTRNAMMLHEQTDFLPVRYYIPPSDVRRELLVASETTTGCPYKGWADYHHVRIGDALHRDLVWRYKTPLPEVARIQGRFCFFNEHVEILVDGQPEARMKTPWSRPTTS